MHTFVETNPQGSKQFGYHMLVKMSFVGVKPKEEQTQGWTQNKNWVISISLLFYFWRMLDWWNLIDYELLVWAMNAVHVAFAWKYMIECWLCKIVDCKEYEHEMHWYLNINDLMRMIW